VDNAPVRVLEPPCGRRCVSRRMTVRILPNWFVALPCGAAGETAAAAPRAHSLLSFPSCVQQCDPGCTSASTPRTELNESNSTRAMATARGHKDDKDIAEMEETIRAISGGMDRGDHAPTSWSSPPHGDADASAASASSAAGESPGSRSAGPKLLSRDQLYEIFDFYCNFGRSMAQDYQETLDSFMFMKFAKECPGLLETSGPLNRTTVDLIFAKAKPKFERRLDFNHFLDALSAMAEKKYPEYPARDGLRLLLANHLVPHYDLVQREVMKTGETEVPLTGIYARLYDPRSYTGVYAERFRSGDGRINGDTDNRIGRRFKGSTNTGTDETIHDISVLMRPNLHSGGTLMSPVNHSSFRDRKRRDLAASSASMSPHGARPASARSMSSKRRSASRAKVEAEKTNAAAIAEMERALRAAKEGRHEEAMEATLRAQSLTEAAKAQMEAASDRGDDLDDHVDGMVEDEDDIIPEPTDEFLAELRSSAPPLDQEKIQEIFLFYCNFGRTRVQDYQDTLDSFMFMKFAKECPQLMDRTISRTAVDLVFTKAKAKGERRLTFSHFLDALSAIAEKKYAAFTAADALRLLIRRNLAPHYDLVLDMQSRTGDTEVPLSGIFKRLYDPRSYTGVYAERFRSGDGRINGDTDNRVGREFRGSTNTGTDETIHDISVLMRPNLRSGTMMRSRPRTAGGSPSRARPKSARGPSSRLTAATASTAAKSVQMEDSPATRGNWYS
jgi:hypothetical protein